MTEDSQGPTDDRVLAPTPRRGAPRRDHLYPRQARFLDPTSAVRFDGQDLKPTAYAGDKLLLRPSADDTELLEVLRKAAKAEGYRIKLNPDDQVLTEMARAAGIPLDDEQPLIVRINLTRRPSRQPRPAPDVWPVLQHFRALMGDDPRANAVQLEHLLTTAAAIKPAPYIVHKLSTSPYIVHPYIVHALGGSQVGTNPYIVHGGSDPYSPTLPSPTAEYAQPGWGGRMPVVWMGPRPARRTDDELDGARRPVVAILDTGVGKHEWLDDIVDREPKCGDQSIGLDDPATDIERLGVVTGTNTGSLDITAGHGTFIAGLVHQRCPDARLLSVRVVEPDGVISEYEVLQALNKLWLRHKIALKDGLRDQLVDVISLSLGYYHEQESDAAFDPLLLTSLRALSRLGIAVVTSAGNDATSRPLYPAAFAPHRGGVISALSEKEIPLVAVGATNPDGSIALFSNGGPWIKAYRPGAGLVSTMPQTFNAGATATVQVVVDGQVRSTIDPDNFFSGFATWSGTSFAAPIVAGDIAACLNASEALRSRPEEEEHPLETMWAALREAVPKIGELH